MSAPQASISFRERPRSLHKHAYVRTQSDCTFRFLGCPDLRLSQSQTVKFSPSSQAPRISDCHNLRLSNSSQALRHPDPQTQKPRIPVSQTLGLSDSQTLRLSNSQTPRLHAHEYVHNRIGLSDSQALRLSDCQILSDSRSIPASPRIAKTLKLSDCLLLRISDSQILSLSDSDT